MDNIPGPCDAHVHVVGNGSGGSGCWLRVTGWHRPLASLMLRHIGLPGSAMSANLEEMYVERLLQMVRSSSLTRIIILAQDLVYDEAGKPMKDAGSFYVPNDYVLGLAKKHPEFLAAVSIHPARPDAVAELERCLSAGAVMMKCLPNCQNINCNDRRFERFWKRMAEAGLPLLAHTGGEHTLPVVRPEYADPRILALPLECGVKVIAAHCGTKSGLTDPEYFHIFKGLTRRFENLYGDNSAFNVPLRGRHVKQCLESPLRERMIHGSDFPVPVYGHWAWMRGFVDWKAFRASAREQNIIERDYQLKVAMGFPPESFTRIYKLLPESG
ncbi:MAG TPA: amidohydrolase family protein [Candidatus Dormibacteraeota bacterium]|nr:amidohydrolase family protein [Candidatus Dormibacteraeota bacterium]